MKKEFLIKKIQDPYKLMSKTYINFQKTAISAYHCIVKNCNGIKNIKLLRVQKLYRNVEKSDNIVIKYRAKKL
jgi:hypothetical protein